VTADECPLSELPADQCACPKHRGGQAPGDEPIETVGQPFTATYPGPCARRCDAGIDIGDSIARCWDRADGYAHWGSCP
jgi:hypothetical protein